jgi:hypothetical protein
MNKLTRCIIFVIFILGLSGCGKPTEKTNNIASDTSNKKDLPEQKKEIEVPIAQDEMAEVKQQLDETAKLKSVEEDHQAEQVNEIENRISAVRTEDEINYATDAGFFFIFKA